MSLSEAVTWLTSVVARWRRVAPSPVVPEAVVLDEARTQIRARIEYWRQFQFGADDVVPRQIRDYVVSNMEWALQQLQPKSREESE